MGVPFRGQEKHPIGIKLTEMKFLYISPSFEIRKTQESTIQQIESSSSGDMMELSSLMYLLMTNFIHSKGSKQCS